MPPAAVVCDVPWLIVMVDVLDWPFLPYLIFQLLGPEAFNPLHMKSGSLKNNWGGDMALAAVAPM